MTKTTRSKLLKEATRKANEMLKTNNELYSYEAIDAVLRELGINDNKAFYTVLSNLKKAWGLAS